LHASRARHHRVERQRYTRCDGSLPSPLHLAIKRNRIPDDISTRGDVDACSRASRAIYIYIYIANALYREYRLNENCGSSYIETISGVMLMRKPVCPRVSDAVSFAAKRLIM
jgi:hypothetical protein